MPGARDAERRGLRRRLLLLRDLLVRADAAAHAGRLRIEADWRARYVQGAATGRPWLRFDRRMGQERAPFPIRDAAEAQRNGCRSRPVDRGAPGLGRG